MSDFYDDYYWYPDDENDEDIYDDHNYKGDNYGDDSYLGFDED